MDTAPTEADRILDMVKHVTTPHSHLQVSLWQFLLWVTAVCIVCGLAQAIINHLHYVEAKDGSIPPDVIGRSLFFGFLILAAFVGLILGPPFCFLVALWRSSRRVVGAKRTPGARASSWSDSLAGADGSQAGCPDDGKG